MLLYILLMLPAAKWKSILIDNFYVVSSGIQFIFIMSYGIYSVDQCLISVLCTTVRFTIF